MSRDIWNAGHDAHRVRTNLTLEQEAGLEAQFRDLQALGCEKVIKSKPAQSALAGA